ncbi:SEFIR domain-containing protein [Actinokineospora sp. G85]|uniref:SEFIR domain-containing protein n=1 Tax=Actinokineospora sp. G85 TaxID=3406626 RepID=UPI003C787563
MFITYAHDSQTHKDATLELAHVLVGNGVNAQLDQWAEGSRQDWSAWAIAEMTQADFVVVVASPAYKAAGDGFGAANVNRGVQAETAVLRDLLHNDRPTWTRKLLPVVLPGRAISEIPHFLQPHVADHYNIGEITTGGLEDLLRVITDQPRRVRPPLGPLPQFPLPAAPKAAPAASQQQPSALTTIPEVRWRTLARHTLEPPAVDLHLVPVGDQPRIQVRRMDGLAKELGALGREAGLFDPGAALEIRADDEMAEASGKNYDTPECLTVFRSGQRSAAFGLSRATIGRVLIPEDVTKRVTELVRLLLAIDLPNADAYAPAIGLASLGPSTRIGTTADLTATHASVPWRQENRFYVQPEDAYPPALLASNADDVAAELTARLVVAFRKSHH